MPGANDLAVDEIDTGEGRGHTAMAGGTDALRHLDIHAEAGLHSHHHLLRLRCSCYVTGPHRQEQASSNCCAPECAPATLRSPHLSESCRPDDDHGTRSAPPGPRRMRRLQPCSLERAGEPPLPSAAEGRGSIDGSSRPHPPCRGLPRAVDRVVRGGIGLRATCRPVRRPGQVRRASGRTWRRSSSTGGRWR